MYPNNLKIFVIYNNYTSLFEEKKKYYQLGLGKRYRLSERNDIESGNPRFDS